MANKQYFNFIGSVWDLLPLEDQNKMAETWSGYEQVFASVYQKMVENDLNISINNLQSYGTERWVDYTFNPAEKITRPPIYTSTQDLSVGVNLSAKYLLRFSLNGGTPIEIDVRGANPATTTIDEVVNKVNTAIGFVFARTIFDNTIIQLVSQTPAPLGYIDILEPSDPSKDATEFILGLLQSDMPARYPKYPHVYRIQYDKVVSIPTLQSRIRDESEDIKVLIEGQHFGLEPNGLIGFTSEPPMNMWAKKTLLDDETPWHNFGFLMDIYQENQPSYLQVIQGLWYAFWSGPKPRNLQVALYLLFGLPVAPNDGVITRLTSSEIEVTQDKDGAIFSFPIPSELTAVVILGQKVKKYDALVNGIEIVDKISRPGFIEEDIGRSGIQRFLLDEATRGLSDTDETKALRMLEEHTFLPQISVDAFVSPNINLGNVKTFLENIKPLNKTFLFQVIVGNFRDKLAIGESMGMGIGIDITPNLDSNQTTFAEKTILDSYESTNNDALNLDTDGVCMQEGVEIDVFSYAILIESFIA